MGASGGPDLVQDGLVGHWNTGDKNNDNNNRESNRTFRKFK